MPDPLEHIQAADLAGLTVQGLRSTFNQDDPPPRGAKGYPPREFGEWLKRRHLRGLGVAVDGTVYELETERARLTHHQANLAELDERVKRGELIPANLVVERWQGMIANARAKILSTPPKVSPVLSGLTDIPKIERLIRECLYEALTELGTVGSDRTDGESGMAPAAESDSEPMGEREPISKPRRQRRARQIPE